MEFLTFFQIKRQFSHEKDIFYKKKISFTEKGHFSQFFIHRKNTFSTKISTFSTQNGHFSHKMEILTNERHLSHKSDFFDTKWTFFT